MPYQFVSGEDSTASGDGHTGRVDDEAVAVNSRNAAAGDVHSALVDDQLTVRLGLQSTHTDASRNESSRYYNGK